MFTPPVKGERILSNATGNTYWIGDTIGEGSFGVVYECSDSWGNELAVKVLKPRGTYDHVRGAAVAEFEKLQSLRHPNITYIHDAFEYRHTFYIVVERCTRSIQYMIDEAKLDGERVILPLARCVLQAVHFVHVNGFAHQDIHSGNVFVSWVRDEMGASDGALTFKVGDLGIAKFIGEMDAATTILADWIRAPEAIDNPEFGPLDQRMDIYHCGLLFLQVLTGTHLDFSREEVLAGAPRQAALQLPEPYNFAIEKALRRHVAFRTATAMEFWRDLNSPAEGGIPQSTESAS